MSVKRTVTTREIYFNKPRGRIAIAKYLKRKAREMSRQLAH